MNSTGSSLDALKDIKRIMERSGRFISLSGWSGICAGICGLVGAFLASRMLANVGPEYSSYYHDKSGFQFRVLTDNDLILRFIGLAAAVFLAAFISAFFFTYAKSKREGIAIWGATAQRLLINTLVPMVAGGVVVLRLLEMQEYSLIAPACLIFYGLGLINGSKFTLGEIRYLGYLELLLGLINLWVTGFGLVFWAIGFGLLHIIYGLLMWWKYERQPLTNQ